MSGSRSKLLVLLLVEPLSVTSAPHTDQKSRVGRRAGSDVRREVAAVIVIVLVGRGRRALLVVG